MFEDLFEANGWGNTWRDGIYDYVHYHSQIHEVLGIARGKGRVRFGGNKGRIFTLKAGDAAILPAGTGHPCLSADDGFLVVGGLPADRYVREQVHDCRRPSARAQDHPEGAAAAERSGLRNRRLAAETLEESEMTEYLVRFLVGGAVVSAFAMLSDVLRPKSFAGLFGAAPSVALATLGIAVYRHGPDYAAFQSQAMMAGAIALAVYSVVVCQLPGSRTAASGAGYLALARRLAHRRFRPADPRSEARHDPDPLFPSSLREGRWYEYLIRFALGGAVTVFTGLISSRYGPSVGGLFLRPSSPSSAPAPR